MGVGRSPLFNPKQMQQVQEASLAGHRLSQRGGHLCRDGRPKAQPPGKRRAPRCWQSFRKLSEICNGLRHRTSDGRLDLRANKPADQDKHAQLDPHGQGGIQASIDQDTNNRRANDVVGEIERIGDQPERSPVSRRFRRSGGCRAPVPVRAPGNEAHRRRPNHDRHKG